MSCSSGTHEFYDESFSRSFVFLMCRSAGTWIEILSYCGRRQLARTNDKESPRYRVDKCVSCARPPDCRHRSTPRHAGADHPELDIETYGLTIWDLDRDSSLTGWQAQKAPRCGRSSTFCSAPIAEKSASSIAISKARKKRSGCANRSVASLFNRAHSG